MLPILCCRDRTANTLRREHRTADTPHCEHVTAEAALRDPWVADVLISSVNKVDEGQSDVKKAASPMQQKKAASRLQQVGAW